MRVECEPAQHLGQRQRIAGGHEPPVYAVAQHVAVAGDVGRDDRRRRRERLGDNHAEALAAERRRTQHVRARELGELAPLGHLAQRQHVAVVEHHVRDLVGARAHERERRRNVIAERLERPQQHRQPLAFHRLPDEHDPQRPRLAVDRSRRHRPPGLAHAERGDVIGGREPNAVGHDPIAPAEEASRSPRGCLGHGDAHAQVVHPASSAERKGSDPVRQRVLGVRVEGADERQLAAH